MPMPASCLRGRIGRRGSWGERRGKAEIRRPKSQGNPKPEARRPKQGNTKERFGFQISGFLRISAFDLRISPRWPGLCYRSVMIRAIFKAGPKKGGFIRTTLAPVNDKSDDRLWFFDVAMLLALVGGGIAIMRYLLAH